MATRRDTPSFVPSVLAPGALYKRQVASWMLQANQGKLSNTGRVTLEANASETTVPDSRVGVTSHVCLMPATASAAADLAGENVYVVTGKQTFTIHHPIGAATDRTFTFVILG